MKMSNITIFITLPSEKWIKYLPLYLNLREISERKIQVYARRIIMRIMRIEESARLYLNCLHKRLLYIK